MENSDTGKEVEGSEVRELMPERRVDGLAMGPRGETVGSGKSAGTAKSGDKKAAIS